MEISVADAVSIGIAFAALVFSVRQYYYEKNRNRKEATIHAFDKLEEEVFFKDKYCRGLWYNASSDVINDKRSKEREDAKSFLSRIEHFAVGINTEIYDLATLNRMAGSYILDQYNAWWSYLSKC